MKWRSGGIAAVNMTCYGFRVDGTNKSYLKDTAIIREIKTDLNQLSSRETDNYSHSQIALSQSRWRIEKMKVKKF
jgi:hypothetical protein